jgi:hypothetical protein
MHPQVSIEIRTGSILAGEINLEYRPSMSDPDSWEFRRPATTGPPWDSGDWLCDRLTREARFSTNFTVLAPGTGSPTIHDVGLVLSGVAYVPGINSFSKGQSGAGRAGPCGYSTGVVTLGLGGVFTWRVTRA